ncbi:dnaJ homolog subfamily C GRV2-like [Sesamum indicum]|uniref:DnaJ homolog subfamily C GRV2-like n=1 Tax=Sesamum indicum TaxID=4182 RepID=A0A8M8USS5_SESIN|nr:dnaJ homolog subfamily C GRV2-like [Sesamum indicum]
MFLKRACSFSGRRCGIVHIAQYGSDDAEEIVTPTPRVKRILSSSRCLPHIAQAMLSGEPTIVDAAAALVKAIVTRTQKQYLIIQYRRILFCSGLPWI